MAWLFAVGVTLILVGVLLMDFNIISGIDEAGDIGMLLTFLGAVVLAIGLLAAIWREVLR